MSRHIDDVLALIDGALGDITGQDAVPKVRPVSPRTAVAIRRAVYWYTPGLLGGWLAEVTASFVAIGRTWWVEMAVSLAWWAYYGHGPGETIKSALDQRVEPSPTKPGSIRP